MLSYIRGINMVRPAAKETKKQYTVMLKPGVVKEVDRIAEKYGLTRSQFMGNLIELAVEEARLMEKAGLFKAVIIADKVMLKFKEALFSGKISLDKNGNLEIRK